MASSITQGASTSVRTARLTFRARELFFAILKRGVTGTFHSVSEQHLGRYVDEFAFRWNTRSSLGIEDAERARLMVKGAAGKRLTYQGPDEKKGAT